MCSQTLTPHSMLQFWDRSKRLRDGALICLLSDQPEPSMIFGTVQMRGPDSVKSLKHSASRWVLCQTHPIGMHLLLTTDHSADAFCIYAASTLRRTSLGNIKT